jgi:hypothetical protein
MSTTALAPVETTPAVREFALADYLSSLNNPVRIQHQQALAAAYDAACKSLIGPNDIQKDGAREFKKKSAWRKLARHFNISVAAALESVRVETTPDGFTAFAVATATAPWGQTWTDVGACGSDEATGRRTITVADAVATAMTRASNRAVSNLIAMGEVSAEEVGGRKAYGNESRAGGSPKSDADKLMPFGRNKGTRLGDIDKADLESTLKWCRENGKTDVATAISNVLNDRALGLVETVGLPEDEDDSLPF